MPMPARDLLNFGRRRCFRLSRGDLDRDHGHLLFHEFKIGGRKFVAFGKRRPVVSLGNNRSIRGQFRLRYGPRRNGRPHCDENANER